MENSRLCLDSTLGFSVCGSGGFSDIFYEREKGLSVEALS
jgi:hypothetical protein